MDREDPQFWRGLNHLGNGLLFAGMLLALASVSCADAKHPSPDPPIGMIFGIFLMVVGFVLLAVSGSTLERMENEVIDRHYEQKREEPAAVKIRCRACRALNDEKNRFCGGCGKPL